MRKLGIDYGNKYIGLAISDRSNTVAHSKEVIMIKDLRQLLDVIKEYIKEYEIDEIVVGIPTSLNGTAGPRVEKTVQFINFLNNNLDLEITKWDERFTSLIAEDSMLEADLTRQKRKKLIDKIAAGLILQNYLDYLNKKDGDQDE